MIADRLASWLERHGRAVTLRHTEPGATPASETIRARGLFGRDAVQMIDAVGAGVGLAVGRRNLILSPSTVRNSTGVARRPRVGDTVVLAHYSTTPPPGARSMRVATVDEFSSHGEAQVYVVGLEG